MNIFQAIEKDHSDILGMVQQLSATSVRAKKKRTDLLHRLQSAVENHLQAEEALLFALLEESRNARAELLSAREEHATVRMLLERLLPVPVEDEHWAAKLKVVGNLLESHIEQEETVLFDRAKSLLVAGEASRELADQFFAFKEHIQEPVPEKS